MQHCHHHSSDPSSEADLSPLARVVERLDTLNRLTTRHSSFRAVPCPVLVSSLLSSHNQTSHHRDLKHCQDCADLAASLSQPLQCLLRMGNIQWRSVEQVMMETTLTRNY